MAEKTGAISLHFSHYVPSGKLINEQASGGGTITAHTDAGDVTINLPYLCHPKMYGDDSRKGGVATDYSKQQLNWLKGLKKVNTLSLDLLVIPNQQHLRKCLLEQL